jgi:8-oxo-dGTP pyrophosphatase MutT (NUDIX family)
MTETNLGDLAQAFRAYAARHPQRAAVAELFLELLREGTPAFERSHAFGHFTGSAWLVDAAGERVLLTHHRKLDLWLQLGGHADGDVDLAEVALREAIEESGLTGLVREGDVFDLDRHWIPARGEEPGHWHYDVRYVVRASDNEHFVVSPESHALAWRVIDELTHDAGIDGSVRRMAGLWLRERV